MMLMPAGPPALIISGLAEFAKVSEVEKFAVAKVLAVCRKMHTSIRSLLTSADHVRPVSTFLSHYYWCFEGHSSGT